MHKALYPRLAAQNIWRDARFYGPYLLTILCTVAAFYITYTLAGAQDLPQYTRYAYLSMFMTIGCWVIGLFSVIFLFYTNGFLIKRRKKELGLYNVLGMGKRHIACVLGMETLYFALAGIVGGILLGMLLQKLVTLLLFRLMRLEGSGFGFYISPGAIGATVIWFGCILLVNLLVNLRRIHVQNPLETMREGSAGEREPKTRLLLAVAGVICLGGGYAISLLVRDAIEAFAFYFVAVFLVIIGTYCLFTAVSIAVLKALRANKGFYYRPQAFITVSGMLYRMKRNAVGLANICILSTMVLVMVSGTLALFLGTSDAVQRMYPGDINLEVRYNDLSGEPFQPDAMLDAVEQTIQEQGLAVADVRTTSYLSLSIDWTADGSAQLNPSGGSALYAMTADAYAAQTGQARPVLQPNEALVRIWYDLGDSLDILSDSGTLTYAVQPGGETIPLLPVETGTESQNVAIVVADEAALLRLAQAAQTPDGQTSPMRWHAYIDTTGTDAQKIACAQALSDWNAVDNGQDTGQWHYYAVVSQADRAGEMYALNGGFFFLGVFLGLVFLLAAVLILYYKQISEGYEDCERYQIMQKVGLDKKMVRRSVNAQILVVFFLPLAVAAIHVAFDFRLMVQLLSLFGLSNVPLTLACTVGSLLGFALLYGGVYWLTARAYYRIVQ